jgi:hypothetical protein
MRTAAAQDLTGGDYALVERPSARAANLILGRTGEAFWQDESFDHRGRDEVEPDRIAHYVEYKWSTTQSTPA